MFFKQSEGLFRRENTCTPKSLSICRGHYNRQYPSATTLNSAMPAGYPYFFLKPENTQKKPQAAATGPNARERNIYQ